MKAAYLFNFVRYVEWPASAFPSREAPLTICIIGADPFGPALDRIIEGRSVQGRVLQVRRFDSPEAAVGCQMAYLHERDLSRLKGSAILTVGDDEGFASRGGIIGFVPMDETVRFEINLGAARSQGLQISSRMLALAPRVYGVGSEP